MSRERIRVFVADDHDLLREGVSSSLAGFDDLEVVGDASTAEAAISGVGQLLPDVVVIDLVIRVMGGVEAIRQLRASHPDMGLLALSSYTESDRIREAVGAGANGYLVKSVDSEGLARAVRSAAAGKEAFSAEVTRILAAPAERGNDLLQTLTPREAEIAALMAEGRTNAEIAATLGVSVFTIKNHVSNVLMKLHVHSHTEAAAFLLTSERSHSKSRSRAAIRKPTTTSQHKKRN
jgi:DNA-binding NarL/FixJ family response regulator